MLHTLSADSDSEVLVSRLCPGVVMWITFGLAGSMYAEVPLFWYGCVGGASTKLIADVEASMSEMA